MFLPLPTPAEMVIWDRETIQAIGIPGVTLMESASREALDVLLSEYGSVRGREIFCFAGAGNNGGDALAVARHLTEHDAEVTVFIPNRKSTIAERPAPTSSGHKNSAYHLNISQV